MRILTLLLSGTNDKINRAPKMGRAFKNWRDFTYMNYRLRVVSPDKSPFNNLSPSIDFTCHKRMSTKANN